MALCTPDAVVRYANLTNPDWDLLDQLCDRAAAVIEAYCRCSFSLEQRDELYDIAPGQQSIVLRGYPVQEISAIYDGLSATSQGRQLQPSEFVLDAAAGIVRLRSGSFTPGAAACRVVYTAGYSSVPDSVAQAATMLVADWYRSRPDGRAAQEAVDGYSVRYNPEALPPQVRQLLEPFRRQILP